MKPPLTIVRVEAEARIKVLCSNSVLFAITVERERRGSGGITESLRVRVAVFAVLSGRSKAFLV